MKIFNLLSRTAVLAVCILVFIACSPWPSDPGSTTTTVVATTTIPSTVPTTTSTSSTTTTIPPDTEAIPSDFDLTPFITTAYRGVPSSAAPVGNFRIRCQFSHLAYDDPIVYPNKPGASHLHMFAGNSLTDAYSTYRSLRTAGDSTCNGGPVNRSAYWMPAVLNADGKVVVPEFFDIYYKSDFGSAQSAQAKVRSTVDIPPGLKMIAGFNMANPQPDSHFLWYCELNQIKSTSIPNCAFNELVGVRLQFPQCWDGRLDSADHRSHLAYIEYDDTTGQPVCPTSHPRALPQLTFQAWFKHDGNSKNWYLSSDRMPGMIHVNGSTFHADWMGGWDQGIADFWVQECIREMRDCIDGEIGDGRKLRNPPQYNGPLLLERP